MPIDPSIALQSNAAPLPGLDFGNALRTGAQVLQLREQQQQFRSQNALRGILSQPGAIGPDGNPTQAAMQQVMGVDPNYGMKLHQNALINQEHQMQFQNNQLKRQEMLQELVDPVRAAAMDAYTKTNGTEEAKREAGQRVLNEGLDEVSRGGGLSEQEKQNMNRGFDPVRISMMSERWQTYQKTQSTIEKQKRDEEREEAAQKETKRWHEATENNAGWSVMSDPSNKDADGNPAQFVYNPRTREARTLAGEPYTPGGAAKLSSNPGAALLGKETPEERASYAGQLASGMPTTQAIPGYGRDVGPMRAQAHSDAIKLIMRQNPGMDAEAAGMELARRNIDFVAGKRSVGQLETGLGATRQALGQLDYNVDQVSEDLKHLKSTDISPVINALVRGVEKWDGDPAYSQLFFHMQAAATESARILSGGVGSVAQLNEGARQEAEKWANVNMTPAMWNGDGKDIKGVAQSMKDEGQERVKTYESAIRQQRSLGQGGTPQPGTPEGDKRDGGGNPTPFYTGDAAPAKYPQARKAKDGKWYVERDGKYLAVPADAAQPPAKAAPAEAAPAQGSGPQEGATATNSKTGQRLIFKGGQWVPHAAAPVPSSAPAA